MIPLAGSGTIGGAIAGLRSRRRRGTLQPAHRIHGLFAAAGGLVKEVPVVAEHMSFVVNGKRLELDVEPRRLLVQVLREDLDLTGTHIGCDTSQCGACTVTLDGRAVKSCTVLALQADGSSVRTIEGLAEGDRLHPLQAAFWEKHGLQCGFCTPGVIMAAADLLERTTDPSDEEIRHAIEGNYCRCTGYQNIVAAIREAAVTLREGAAAPVAQA